MQNEIAEWKNKKEKVARENKKFLKRLKGTNSKKLDETADQLHLKVFEKIDCLSCANCCKTIPPILNETDVKRISKKLGMKVSNFKNEFVTVDEDQDMVLNQSPCHFLEADNTCRIYEFRPKACRQYPHTDQSEFTRNIKLHAKNADYCPAVFHILEELKKVY